MIEARGLTKRYGDKVAVDDLSFSVKPGQVTGFLGPNGAGKTTTMRMILGLDHPSAGTVTVNGKPFAGLYSPMREVGALLDAKAVHGGRSAYSHLHCLARTNGIPRRRVDEVIGLVGLDEVKKKRAKGFSLGMGQRLGIAAALLGDSDLRTSLPTAAGRPTPRPRRPCWSCWPGRSSRRSWPRPWCAGVTCERGTRSAPPPGGSRRPWSGSGRSWGGSRWLVTCS